MAISSDSKARVTNMLATEPPPLPIDAIIHIMSYLSVSDRMSAGLVNQAWREASLAIKFVDQQAVHLGRPCGDNLNEALNVLQHSTRPFFHFVFHEAELKRNMPIWDQYGPHIRSLMLLSCDLREKTLVEILKCCSALRRLCIDASRECLMSGRLLEDENDIKELSEKFQHLQELSLTSNRYLSDTLFNRFVATCPNLESLSLMGCPISSFHCGLFQQENGTMTPEVSKSVMTFLNTLRYLKRQSHKLKHLNFGYTLIDSTALTMLSALEGLKLHSLFLQDCYQLSISGIKSLAQYQTSLKVLDLSYCRCVTDASVVYICKNLINLETLRIKRCRAVTDIGVQHVLLLRNLKELDISEVELLTGDCITRGLCSGTCCSAEYSNGEQEIDLENISPNYMKENHTTEDIVRNENMTVFLANALHLHEESIERISTSFPNLRVLEVSYCFSGVTDKTIQMIFKELVHLHTLKISHCNMVSDAGLTGMGSGNHENLQKTQIESIPDFTESRFRISLRSRAEEEIVRDADRKREIMKLCEGVSTPLNLNVYSGFSLLRLKCLRELDLSGCNKITDVSLKHAFVFPELRVLNLSQCQQVTSLGLDYLSRNNPAIEDLNLNQCHNITDKGISYLAQRLHRLKRLLIQSCSQLTDHTLEFIKLYCKSLQYLNASDCRGMTMTGLKSLPHRYIDWVKQTGDVTFSQRELYHKYQFLPMY